MGAQLLACRADERRGIRGSGRAERESEADGAPHQMTLDATRRELRGEHHLPQRGVECGVRRFEDLETALLDSAEGIDDRGYESMTAHAPPPQFRRIDELRPGTPSRGLIEVARDENAERPRLCVENVLQTGGNLVEATNGDDLTQRQRAAKIRPRETVRAAHVLENAAPDENIDAVHEVQRGLERFVQRRIGLGELTAADQRASGAYGLRTATLPGCDGDDEEDESKNQQMGAAAHDKISRPVP